MDLDPDSNSKISQQIIQDIHRPGDIAFRHPVSKFPIWELVLSETSKSGGEHVINRLMQTFQSGQVQSAFTKEVKKYHSFHISVFTCTPKEILTKGKSGNISFLNVLQITRDGLEKCINNNLQVYQINNSIDS